MRDPLYMVQMRLPARLAYGSRTHAWEKADPDPGYRMHALLTRLFGEAAPKPFFAHSRGREVEILGYSSSDAGALQNLVQLYGEPTLVQALTRTPPASKPMPDIPVGQRLGFTVNVVPTVRTCTHRFKKGAEVDAWLAACQRLPESSPKPLRQEVYSDWLRATLRRHGSVQLHTLEILGMRGVRLERRNAQGKFCALDQREVTFRGVFEVTDADLFRKLLRRGIGRHRAFGFGMVRLSPPGRQGV
ncbi:MAG: type I-E CRISPR-associated protein Cas6/Cse3/CasE [Magnetococcales bacterium]|nr:type I-E CRISPR-associated protein Cas6/Cse3/CasE [Magnetococcales bacterium]